MAAGDRCCAVGVIRLVMGDVFPVRQIVLECHHGIEDRAGAIEFGRIEPYALDWKRARSLVTAAQWKGVLAFVGACEEELMKHHKPAKGKRLEKFEDERPKNNAPPMSGL